MARKEQLIESKTKSRVCQSPRLSKTEPLLPQKSSGIYINRELSLISFNERVLSLGQDRSIPILERLKYLCIVANNLDELFEIRVAGLKARSHEELGHSQMPDGLTIEETLTILGKRTQSLVQLQYEILNKSVIPELKKKGINLLDFHELDNQQKKWASAYFKNNVLPILTPLGLDPLHPFPKVLNKSLNFIIEMQGKDSYGRKGRVAIVQAPRLLSRIIEIPKKNKVTEITFINLSSLIEAHATSIFPGMEILGIFQFRVTRNSDLYVDDEEVTDLRQALKGELSQRNYGDAVRIEADKAISSFCLNYLLTEFKLKTKDCYLVDGPVNLGRLITLPDCVDKPKLKFKFFSPKYPEYLKGGELLFDYLKREDVLLHHPYECFDVVAEFINNAAEDKNVVAIFQTIYRTGSTSGLMRSLINAVNKGKEVTVILELMARFDEETNINWASKLEEIGAHVVFGVVGNKTHAKMCLIVRQEGKKLIRYCHLGTGNYHPKTAKLYTDFSLLTSNKSISAEIHEIFQRLTGLGKVKSLRHIWQSPFRLHKNVIRAIKNEIVITKAGGKGKIVARMNSLVETQVIDALYEASKCGVSIELLVRGVCMLRPGVAGLSDNITVRSTVGRFLEHSRIFFFRNNGKNDLFLSSADWMDRNFFRRVEIAFPIFNESLKERVFYEGLQMHFTENAINWRMSSDGSYQLRKSSSNQTISCQDGLLKKYS